MIWATEALPSAADGSGGEGGADGGLVVVGGAGAGAVGPAPSDPAPSRTPTPKKSRIFSDVEAVRWTGLGDAAGGSLMAEAEAEAVVAASCRVGALPRCVGGGGGPGGGAGCPMGTMVCSGEASLSHTGAAATGCLLGEPTVLEAKESCSHGR